MLTVYHSMVSKPSAEPPAQTSLSVSTKLVQGNVMPVIAPEKEEQVKTVVAALSPKVIKMETPYDPYSAASVSAHLVFPEYIPEV